jgi:hypothetical protein
MTPTGLLPMDRSLELSTSLSFAEGKRFLRGDTDPTALNKILGTTDNENRFAAVRECSRPLCSNEVAEFVGRESWKGTYSLREIDERLVSVEGVLICPLGISDSSSMIVSVKLGIRSSLDEARFPW